MIISLDFLFDNNSTYVLIPCIRILFLNVEICQNKIIYFKHKMIKFTKILVIFVTLVILSQSFKVFYSKNVQTTTKSEIVVNA